MTRIKTIKDVDLTAKRVLVRVDFNVPLDAKKKVTDATRIVAALPTIRHLIACGACVILVSHLGRPKGKRTAKYSLQPVAATLAEKLEHPVVFVKDCIGKKAVDAVAQMKPGSVILLENLRFHPGEEANDPKFAAALAGLAEAFVNDAFGAAHRAHASTAGVADHLPIKVAGLLIEKELAYLGDKISAPERPFTVILGGAKVSDKINVIDTFLEKADALLIGGAMAYTFILAQGGTVGKSLTEPDKVDLAKAALKKAQKRGVKLLLPVDNIAVDALNFNKGTVGKTRLFENHIDKGEPTYIPKGWEGVDIGPKTIELFRREITAAKTILWNGPMGVFEIDACNKGTFAVAEAVARASAVSIIGGGDSVKAINQSGYADKVTFMSTGGGASLNFLEGKVLPGIAALETVETAPSNPSGETTTSSSRDSKGKCLIVGNWKMNKDTSEAVVLAEEIASTVGHRTDVQVAICPPFTALESVGKALEGVNVQLGAQNMHPEPWGAYTGEISAEMLRHLFATFVILGHSERRQYFGETDAFINQKVLSALENNLRPILCVGETLEQREAGDTLKVIQAQLDGGLAKASQVRANRLVIAYEPVWAIGTGKTATPEMAQEVHAAIRDWLCKRWEEVTAGKIRILYGGSMKPENAAELLSQRDIDGGLIGGASLKPLSFVAIVEASLRTLG